jgi:hypothetical protein
MTLCIVSTFNSNKYCMVFSIPEKVIVSIEDIEANICDQLISDGDPLHFKCQKTGATKKGGKGNQSN